MGMYQKMFALRHDIPFEWNLMKTLKLILSEIWRIKRRKQKIRDEINEPHKMKHYAMEWGLLCLAHSHQHLSRVKTLQLQDGYIPLFSNQERIKELMNERRNERMKWTVNQSLNKSISQWKKKQINSINDTRSFCTKSDF